MSCYSLVNKRRAKQKEEEEKERYEEGGGIGVEGGEGGGGLWKGWKTLSAFRVDLNCNNSRHHSLNKRTARRAPRPSRFVRA